MEKTEKTDKTEQAQNAINWFEITVADMDRATRFYEELLGVTLRREEFFGSSLAIFPARETGVRGALLHDANRKEGGAGGTVIYLNAGRNLDACIERVARLGGTLLVPRTEIGEAGSLAVVRDLDGNSVGLHQPR